MFIGYAQVSRVDRNLPLQGDALTEALSEAEERLADRTFFTLDAERWDAFIAALDAPHAVTRASNGCSANHPFLTPNRDNPFTHREVAANTCSRGLHSQSTRA